MVGSFRIQLTYETRDSTFKKQAYAQVLTVKARAHANDQVKVSRFQRKW